MSSFVVVQHLRSPAWFPQVSYPANGVIPLRLVLTSENHEALDLLTVPHVINVQLVRVMGFRDGAATVRPLTLKDRTSFHHSRVVAKAHWELDGHTKELTPNERHSRTRWRIKLKGEFQREPGVVLDPSFEGPGMAKIVRSPTLGAKTLR